MEKKKMKKTALSLGLVATLGVGATLAYFTGVTEIVTNTFNLFGDSGNPIQLRIDEHAVDVDTHVKGTNGELDYKKYDDTQWLSEYNETAELKRNGVVYEDLLPGQIIDKDPTVYVAQGSAECWVVAKVTGLNQVFTGDVLKFTTAGGINDNWLDITNNVTGAKPDEKYYLYHTTVTEENTASQEYELPAIFTQLQVYDTVEEVEGINDIEVKAAAAQAKGITKSESITQALKRFDDKLSYNG